MGIAIQWNTIQQVKTLPTATGCNVFKSQRHYAEQMKPCAKKVHPVWFLFYKVQGQAKLIYGHRNQKISGKINWEGA